MHWIAQLVSLALIRWIVIYPVNSATQFLNKWGLVANKRIIETMENSKAFIEISGRCHH